MGAPLATCDDTAIFSVAICRRLAKVPSLFVYSCFLSTKTVAQAANTLIMTSVNTYLIDKRIAGFLYRLLILLSCSASATPWSDLEGIDGLPVIAVASAAGN